jgi:hypothetical protein
MAADPFSIAVLNTALAVAVLWAGGLLGAADVGSTRWRLIVGLG